MGKSKTLVVVASICHELEICAEIEDDGPGTAYRVFWQANDCCGCDIVSGTCQKKEEAIISAQSHLRGFLMDLLSEHEHAFQELFDY